jgi:hypothetical protein
MNFCQRVSHDDFLVSEIPDDPICGKPARFQSKLFDDEDGREIILWLCAECFDEYEAQFGSGAWADATGGPADYMEEA